MSDDEVSTECPWCLLEPCDCSLKWCLDCGDSSTCEYDERFVLPPTECEDSEPT